MTTRLLGNLTNGILFIVSAPAGTGKTTLVNKLIDEFTSVRASVSCTTRQPRAEEKEGRDYHFLSVDEFETRIASGDFLEHVKLYGDYYGTSRAWLEQELAKRCHIVLVIDTQGALQLKEKLKATSIFIAPPSEAVLEERLQARQTEPQEIIEKRLAWAKNEMQAIESYDYLIINDDLEIAYQALRSIVIAEEHRIR